MHRFLPVAVITAMVLAAFASSAIAAPGGVPLAVSLPATEVTPTSGTLNGTIDSSSTDSGYAFEWGTTVDNMAPEAFGAAPATSDGAQPVSHRLSGLAPGRTYVYRLIVTSDQGGIDGEVRSFTTEVMQPPPNVLPKKLWSDEGLKFEVAGSNPTMERTSLAFALPEAGRGTVTGMVETHAAFKRSFTRDAPGNFKLPATLSNRAVDELRQHGFLRVLLRVEFTPAGSKLSEIYRKVVELRPFSITSYGVIDNNRTVTATLRTPRAGRLVVRFLLRDKLTGGSFNVKSFKTRERDGGSRVYSAPLTAAARRAISVGRMRLMVTAQLDTDHYSARMQRARFIKCRYCGAR